MKNNTKIVAGLLAMASMMSSATGITANAMNDTVEDIYAFFEQEIVAMAVSSSSSYYANYDSYSTSKLSPTKHYLSAVAEEGQTLPFGNIYLYINMNAIPGVVGNYLGHLDSTRFITAAFYPNATISNIVGTDYTAQTKQISLYWNANESSGTASRCNELFRYDLEHYSGTGIINSEMALHRYTSQSPLSPTTTIVTTCGNDLKKIVYSLGDVDRDGDVDLTDKQLVLKYYSNLMEGNPSRTSVQIDLDEVAFCLAADCDQDGDVDLYDAVRLAQYIDGNPNVSL